MNPYTESQVNTSCSLQTFIEFFQGVEDTQTSSYSSWCVVFMSLGIAKIDQEPIAKELSDVSFIALDDFHTDVLVGTDHVSVVFGVKLRRQFGGIDHITE